MKKEARGAKKGRVITWDTHPEGIVKNKYFLGCKVTESEHEELSTILQRGKEVTGLKSVELIKKLFYDFAKKNKIIYKK